jgi:hypothetical protein
MIGTIPFQTRLAAQDRTPFDAFGDLRPELLHEEADQVLDDIEVHLHSLLYVNERYMPDVNFDRTLRTQVLWMILMSLYPPEPNPSRNRPRLNGIQVTERGAYSS